MAFCFFFVALVGMYWFQTGSAGGTEISSRFIEPEITEAALVLGVVVPEAGLVPLLYSDESDQDPKVAENLKVAYLTFDDGPSEVTPLVLDILKEYQVPASFFVIGSQVEGYPEIVQRAHWEGHLIGNHTYSHKYRQIYAGSKAFFADLDRAEAVLMQVIGEQPRIIRAPGGTRGNFTFELAGAVLASGYQLYDWNVDSRDTAAPLVAAEIIRDQVLRQAADKAEAIILLHDGPGKITLPKALPGIIEGLQQQGFVFSVINEDTTPIVALYH